MTGVAVSSAEKDLSCLVVYISPQTTEQEASITELLEFVIAPVLGERGLKCESVRLGIKLEASDFEDLIVEIRSHHLVIYELSCGAQWVSQIEGACVMAGVPFIILTPPGSGVVSATRRVITYRQELRPRDTVAVQSQLQDQILNNWERITGANNELAPRTPQINPEDIEALREAVGRGESVITYVQGDIETLVQAEQVSIAKGYAEELESVVKQKTVDREAVLSCVEQILNISDKLIVVVWKILAAYMVYGTVFGT